MGNCCSPRLYGKVFSEKTARRDARRYRRKGLKDTEREVVDFLRGRVEAVIDVGGGVGSIDVELLKAGARRAVDVELSPSYEPEARRLAEEAGVADGFEYRVANVAADDLEPADAVVMHRVVCCYPDGEELVRRGAAHAERFLLVTLPRDAVWVRAGVRALNFGLWVLRLKFRTYAHPVARVLAAAEGMSLVHERRGRVWQLAVLER